MMCTLDEEVNGATLTPTSPTLKQNTWLGPEQKLYKHIRPTYSIERTCSWQFPRNSEERDWVATAGLLRAMEISLRPWPMVMFGMRKPEGY